MSAVESLRRLYRVRKAQERMRGSALQAATHELRRLETALQAARYRARLARANLPSFLQSGSLEDRIAGFEEIAAADRLVTVLSAQIRSAQEFVTRAKEQFFATRTQRQQAETLMNQSVSRAQIEANRKTQAALDERHGARLHWTSSSRLRKTREIA